MTAPTLAKTWQFDVNQAIRWVSFDESNRRSVWAIKESLIGFPLSPWVVKGSSNSVAAGMDNVDRWVTSNNLVYGANHSWIVLQQDGLNAGFQLCIDFRFSGGGTVVMSPSAGFTGGAINARPTAVDEVTCTYRNAADASWGILNIGDWRNTNLHVMQSTDGECTRIFQTVGAADTGSPNYGNPPVTMLWSFFEKIQDPVPNYSIPVVGMWCGNTAGTEMASYPEMTVLDANSSSIRSRDGATNMRLAMTWDHSYNFPQASGFLTGANQWSGEYPMMPVGLYGVTVGKRGRHGTLADMWAGLTYPLAGYTLPDAATPTYVKVGSLYLPWDGVTAPSFV